MRGTLWMGAVVLCLSLTSLMGCGDEPPDVATQDVNDASQSPSQTGEVDGGEQAGRGASLDAGSSLGGNIDAGSATSPAGDGSSGPAAQLADASANVPADAGNGGGNPLPGVDGGITAPPGAQGQLDLLFVIDNSGSMASEQRKLAEQLPRLVRVLTSGDRCAGTESSCKLDDTSQPPRRFRPIADLHLGVVSTNMGGIDEPTGTQAAVLACRGLGDEAKLQSSVDVAVDGVIAGRQEFQAYEQGEVVLEPRPECALPAQPRYQEYTAGASIDAEVAARFSCVAQLGVRGCPYEQQLEAMWKALAPSNKQGELYTFLNGSSGQGDGYNQGFLRDDAVLAVVHVTDEEDCSIPDAGKVMFAQTAEATNQYGPLNLRCGLHADDAQLVQATSRYVDGLTSLKPNHKERIVFGAIVGIPVDSGDKSIDEVLALAEMQFQENPLKPGFPRSSCTGLTGGRIDEAYPPRRFLEVAKAFGDQAVLHSICADTYAPAIDGVVSKIVSAF